jgi:4a-hydroxytetrahydrobiopterin dehydratase
MSKEEGMSDSVTPQRFHEFDWRVIRDAATVHYRAESFAQGVALVSAIEPLTPSASNRLGVDLRPDGVTIHLRGNEPGRLSEGDVALARDISSAARELGLAVDLTGLQTIQVAIDAVVIPDVLPFWRAVLGYEKVGGEDLEDARFEGPPFWFQQMDAPRPQRNRIHIDVYVPHDQAEARVAAALAAGGHLVSDENAPEWWTLADVEGNEVDVAPWPDLG